MAPALVAALLHAAGGEALPHTFEPIFVS